MSYKDKCKHMIRLIISLFLFLNLFVLCLPVHADTKFEMYINDFYMNQEMASQLLREVESDLKLGFKEKGCIKQIKAANYGIKGTESLIMAFEINGSISDMSDIKAGLNKWKELRDNC